MNQLSLPEKLNRPFLAYGSFKPGELRFKLIEPFVSAFNAVQIKGLMKEKDGVPLFYSILTKPYAWFEYEAFVIEFKKGSEKEAYQIICDNEPNTYYRWVQLDDCNLLEGKTSLRGLNEFMDFSWSFKHDPYFSEGLASSKEISFGNLSSNAKLNPNYYEFFCNQSAYMLLWSIIERFCTIKYGNISPTEKLKKLSADPQIDWSFLVNIVQRNDEIFRSDRDKEKLKLNPNASSKKILDYYYGLRSNMVHRGKEVFGDLNRIQFAFNELHQIVAEVLRIHS